MFSYAASFQICSSFAVMRSDFVDCIVGLRTAQVRLQDRSRPFLEPDGGLGWPVLLMYPESMQQDSIQRFSEHDTFDEHLDMVSCCNSAQIVVHRQQQPLGCSRQLRGPDYCNRALMH